MKLRNKNMIIIAAITTIVACEPKNNVNNQTTGDQLIVNKVDDIQVKKNTFFKVMIPIIQKANQNLIERRLMIQSLIKDEQIQELKNIAAEYKINVKDNSSWQYELLARVNEIPLELALMQAAHESNWGQSRFAKQANNLFGHMCYQKGCGIVPKNREKNAKREIAKFNSIEESIKNYMFNLNTNSAYKEFRRIRENMMTYGQKIDPFLLTEGLEKYSVERQAYVQKIKLMMRYNQLAINSFLQLENNN